ncbi:unnamed protein product, partial [Ixodes pacificus]
PGPWTCERRTFREAVPTSASRTGFARGGVWYPCREVSFSTSRFWERFLLRVSVQWFVATCLCVVVPDKGLIQNHSALMPETNHNVFQPHTYIYIYLYTVNDLFSAGFFFFAI